MKILIVTSSCSEKRYSEVCKMRKNVLVDPQQKFFRLLIEGLSNNCQGSVEAISALPVSASTVDRYLFFYDMEESDYQLKYHYLPFLNGKLLRYLTLAISSYVYTKKWIRENKEEEMWIIVDPLCPMLSIPCRRIAQKKGVKVIAVITDIPSLATNMKNRKDSFIKKKCLDLYQTISDKDLSAYDAYVPLTESINEKINVYHKPYCVVEGFADIGDQVIYSEHENYVMYAGGVYEKYGVKNLVEAFTKIDTQNVELHVYGDGSYVDELKQVTDVDSRVKYMGCVLPNEVVEKEKRALLLVNPRPCDEEFSKYSFPSKTMEYLLSGTAVVSTRLPGIPEEYFEYMYSFEDSSVEGICSTLSQILKEPKVVLCQKGLDGRRFVLEHKNNLSMSKKILDLIKEIKSQNSYDNCKEPMDSRSNDNE